MAETMTEALDAEALKRAETYMAMALEEARKAEGGTRPNPCVGVVIVKDGEVVGTGFHVQAGGPHAEVFALQMAGSKARGADVYSTLEPCDHTGKTPPCTKALIEAGVARVFVGCTDTNPKVSGRGIQRLRDNGIQVFTDILKEECTALNAPFFKHVSTGRPFVTLKVAATSDGMIATSTGHSRWITCNQSLKNVHDLRSRVDAILVGASTVRFDDPELTARPNGVRAHRQPLRVILSSDLATLPSTGRIFASASSQSPVLIVTCDQDEAAIATFKNKGVDVLVLPPDPSGRVAIHQLLDALGKRNVMHLLVEGGAQVFGTFIAQRLFDRLQLYIAPKVLGAGISWANIHQPPAIIDNAFRLRRIGLEPSGDDILVIFVPEDSASQNS